MAEILRQPEKSKFPHLSASCGRAAQSKLPPDMSLNRIIHRTIGEARDAGCDHGGQTRKAVMAVRQVRPDIMADEALTLVQRVRD